RHTRSTRDWSSDVCSSDLTTRTRLGCGTLAAASCCVLCTWERTTLARVWPSRLTAKPWPYLHLTAYRCGTLASRTYSNLHIWSRSEERRVGKEERAKRSKC